MGLSTMIYITHVMKIGSAIQKLMEGYIQTHKHNGDHMTLHFVFQTKESRLTMKFLTYYDNLRNMIYMLSDQREK
jgi:hypothetical protein